MNAKSKTTLILLVLTISMFSVSCKSSYPHQCDTISEPSVTPIIRPAVLGKYGGPWEFVLDSEKLSNFGIYFIYELGFSRAEELTQETFIKTIAWYCTSDPRFPDGDKYQRYNYVINTADEIWVAVWDEDFSFNELRRKSYCNKNSSDDFKGRQKVDLMVNFFPEKPIIDHGTEHPNIQVNWETDPYKPMITPCYLYTPPSDREESEFPGFLDAMSKHFFIAQYAYETGYSGIINYHPVKWVETEVEYAGEIFVNINDCTYSINNHSGTYRPWEEYLSQVELLFAETLGVRPVELRTYDGRLIESLEIPELIKYPDNFCGK